MSRERRYVVSVWLTEEERETLRLLADSTGLSESAILRACFRYITTEAAFAQPVMRIIQSSLSSLQGGEEHGDRGTEA